MGILYTGIEGTTLREIIEQLGNDYYPISERPHYEKDWRED